MIKDEFDSFFIKPAPTQKQKKQKVFSIENELKKTQTGSNGKQNSEKFGQFKVVETRADKIDKKENQIEFLDDEGSVIQPLSVQKKQ